MKVYLVNPPACNGIKMVREGRCMQRKGAWTTVWPPVTLATMAAMLLREGIEVKLDDCIVENISFDQLKLNIEQFSPDLLVINTATASINTDLECAKIAKEVSAAIKTLAFGLHVTALPEESLKSQPALDFVIRGEPEFCLLETVKVLKDSRLKINTVKGLFYRSPEGISHNPDLEFDDNLDALPFPAWELINVHNYLLPLSGEPFLLIMTAKGCPHACLFCPAKPYYGSRLRQRDHKIVVDEMEYNKRRFKVRQFLIWSESFTEDREYTVKLCDEIIDRKLDVSWVCNSRVDKVDLELLRLMQRAGCWMIGYGIESGNQEILDAANKGTTVKQIENAVNMAKLAGLETTGHVIFGLPKETMESGLKTISWLKKLNIDFIQVYCAVPWPSTPLYKIAREKGWLKTQNWELYEQNNCVMEAGGATARQIESLRKMAIIKFYLSPKRVLRILTKINSFKKAGMFFDMFKEFANWI